MTDANALDPIYVDIDTPIREVPYGLKKPRTWLDFTVHLPGAPPLGDRWLRLESLKGGGPISQPFEYQLELRANDAYLNGRPAPVKKGSRTLSPPALLGRRATISLQQPALDTAGTGSPHTHINGVIASFSLVEAGAYRASLRPDLWRLNLCNDYRLFPAMTIKEVIRAVVETKHHIACDLDGVEGVATARKQDWLQSGESDLQFISRLMEKVGIYYYFVHEYGGHRVVFANGAHYVQLQERDPRGRLNGKPLALYYTYSKFDSLEQDCLIHNFSYKQDLTTSTVASRIAEPHAAWEDNATATLANFSGDALDNPHQPQSAATFYQYQIVQYGTSRSEAEDYAKLTLAKLETSAIEISGQCRSTELKPGHLFTTRQHKAEAPAEDVHYPESVLNMRPEFEDQHWVVTQVNEQAQSGGEYQCQFSAVPATGQVAPFAMTQTHMGSILAVVTNAPADKASPSRYLHYLEKNNFSYDTNQFDSRYAGQYPCKDVYVKFTTDGPNAQPTWVKLAGHMQTIPEVDVVVTVARSQDDSEIPEIQSIVQAKGNKTIIPDGALDNTSVGDNYSTSYGDSHAIRFGKTSNGNLDAARQIITAAYATEIFKDVSFSQGGSYSYATAEGGPAGVLSHSYSYGCTFSEFGAARTESHSTVGDSYNQSSVTGISTNISTVQTSRNYAVVGSGAAPEQPKGYEGYASVSTHKNVGSSYSKSTVTGDSVSDNTVDGESKNTSTLGSSHSVSTIKDGSYSKSTLTGGSYSWSKTDTSNQINILGASVNTSVLGANNSTSLTGAQSSQSVTGVTLSLAATGMNNHGSYTGMSNVAQVTSVGNTCNITLGGADFRKEAAIKAKAKQLDAAIGTLSAEITNLKATL